MEGLLAEFDRLQREHLPPIGTELTAAIKGSLVRLQSSPRPAGRDAESESHLARAGEHQQQVIASLEGMLAGLRQWDDYRRFHREVAQLLRDQEEAARTTTALGRQTVGRDLKELTPQESADLKILAEHQFELARRETRLEQEMEQTAATLGQSEPLAAGTLTDAVAEARRLAIAADMSTAGGKIRDNGLGLAPADQQRILQNLQEVLDILANNRRQELGLLARKLGEADKDLNALGKRQEGLRRKIDENATRSGARIPRARSRRPNCRSWPASRKSFASRPNNSAGGWSGCWPRKQPTPRIRRPGGWTRAAAPAKPGIAEEQAAARRRRRMPSGLRPESSTRSVSKSRPNWPWNSRPACRTRSNTSMRREERIAAETREFADLERGGGAEPHPDLQPAWSWPISKNCCATRRAG